MVICLFVKLISFCCLLQATVSLDEDVVHNDFKREMMFYRQAQAAVLEAIPRLHSLNVKTRRPDDYFAQMVKTGKIIFYGVENICNYIKSLQMRT